MDWPGSLLDHVRRRTSRLNRRRHAPQQAEAPARHRFNRGRARLLSGTHGGGSPLHPPLTAPAQAGRSRVVCDFDRSITGATHKRRRAGSRGGQASRRLT